MTLLDRAASEIPQCRTEKNGVEMLNTDIITPPKVEPIDGFLADLDELRGLSRTHRTALTVSSKAYKLGIVDGYNRCAMAQNQVDIMNRR